MLVNCANAFPAQGPETLRREWKNQARFILVINVFSPDDGHPALSLPGREGEDGVASAARVKTRASRPHGEQLA